MKTLSDRHCNFAILIRVFIFLVFYTALFGFEYTSIDEFGFELTAKFQLLTFVDVQLDINSGHFSLDIVAR